MLPYQSVLKYLGNVAFLIATITTGNCFAIEIPSPPELKTRALEAGLHEDNYWHKLLHYYPTSLYPTRLTKGKFESHVDDSRFFLAESGKHDPQAELLATIDLLFTPQADNQPSEAFCRFIARNKWLRKTLALPALLVPEECEEYHQFRKNIGAGSMTLVFPASYLNSPSSMFGHTLLRFDPEDMADESPLLSWSLNFAADVGDESMSTAYAFKGITGGYPGRFNTIPYFEKLNEYGAIENRDIWEYKLDLKPMEIDRVLDHVWELQDILFDYFFFRQNCSFRLLELIDLGRSELNLADQFPYTAIPADTVKAVSSAGIVTKADYRASLGTRLNHAIGTVPKELRHWIYQVQTDPSVAHSDEFRKLAPRMQTRIIRTSNELLTFTSRKDRIVKEVATRRLELLRLISQLEVDDVEQPVPLPAPPEASHKTTTVALTHGRSTDSDYTEAALRLSYHDLLDREIGYARGAGIELGNLRVRNSDDGSTRLEQFDIVHLQSFSDRHRQINTMSWELNVGLARNPIVENDRLAARIEGNVGKSVRLGDNDIAYALLGTSAYQFIDPGETYINAQTRLGLIGYRQYGASQIELTLNAIQRQSLFSSVSFTQNIPLTSNHALRMNITANRFNGESIEDYSLSYRYYF